LFLQCSQCAIKLHNDFTSVWPRSYSKILDVGNESSFNEDGPCICWWTRRKYVTYYVIFVCFCTLHLVFMLRVCCVFVKQWRLKGFVDNYCACFITFHLFSKKLLMFHHLSLFIFHHFFMFCCILFFIKPIASSIGVLFTFHPLSCYSITQVKSYMGGEIFSKNNLCFVSIMDLQFLNFKPINPTLHWTSSQI
jgi:hypothetical protein